MNLPHHRLLTMTLLVISAIGAVGAVPPRGAIATGTSLVTGGGARSSTPSAPAAEVDPGQPIARGKAAAIDGDCADYDDGSAFSFDDKTGSGTIFLKHDGADLFVCMVALRGSDERRFAAVYLDPQADGANATFAQTDDFALNMGIVSGVRTSYTGTGASNGYRASASYDALWQGATRSNADLDWAEYRISLAGFALGACGKPFGVSVYHHWFGGPGDDYGWPSNQWYDQPRTWQRAHLIDAPCFCGGIFPSVADTTISRAAPATPLGDDFSLEISNNPDDRRLALIGFDLAGRLPPDATISSAELELPLPGESPPLSATLAIHGVLQDWNEQTTWATQPETRAGFGEHTSLLADGVLKIDLTTLATHWATGQVAGASLMLEPRNPAMYRRLLSRESGQGPRLVIRCAPAAVALQGDQGPADRAQKADLDRLKQQATEPPVIQLEQGAVSFGDFRLPIPAEIVGDNLALAQWFLNAYRGLLRVQDPAAEFQLVRRSADGRDLYFRQRHDTIPVFAATLIVHIEGRQIAGVAGDYAPEITLSSEPRLTANQAEELARTAVDRGGRLTGDTQLRYLNLEMLGFADRETRLAWQVNLVSGNADEAIFVDANSGAVLYRQPRVMEDFDLDLETGGNQGPHDTWPCWWNPFITADDQWLDENGVNTAFGGSSPDAEGYQAFNNIRAVDSYWRGAFGRDSYDNDGEDIQMYIHVGNPFQNAHYLSGCDIFEYGNGMATMDIVGHEFTHAVDENEAELEYVNQSGAIDESFADIFGHAVDPGNWTIGEGASGGVSRDMSNPPARGDPDHMQASLSGDRQGLRVLPPGVGPVCGSPPDVPNGNDCGSVHTNSGILNKAAFLITDGGTHNTRTIRGLGQAKAQRLLYNVLTNRLWSSSQFIDVRNAAVAEAQSLMRGSGWTSDDVCQAQNAYAAVGLGDGDRDCDGVGDTVDPDSDGDGVSNADDNCPNQANSGQGDWDDDGAGDACDDDDDADGVLDNRPDNCLWLANRDQADFNGNGVGDACDDADKDDVVDIGDNCRSNRNYDQRDTDFDGLGDVCDADDDNDNWNDVGLDGRPLDNCRLNYNPGQEDSDNDGVGDVCDKCPDVTSGDNGDPDNDGLGNPCDADDDNDGIPDVDANGNPLDNCREAPNLNQLDRDKNGIGFVCDAAEQEAFRTALKSQVEKLQFRPEHPFRFPIPICPACRTKYLPERFTTVVNVGLPSGFFARVVDSNGITVAKSELGTADGPLRFTPAPHGITFPRLQGVGLALAPSTTGPATPTADEVRYELEIVPMEGIDLDKTYDLVIQVTEGVLQRPGVYLPLIRR